MFSPFQWIRRRTAEAVLSGIGDAVAVLDTADAPDLAQLRERLALPAAPQPEAEPVTPAAPPTKTRQRR